MTTHDVPTAVAPTDTDATSPSSSALFIFAHPDDESFGLAASMAALTQRGIHVTLVSATRGEVGEILIPELATPDTLGAVRELELRAAMAEVGVHDVRFLGYRDSGMIGTPENDDPRSLFQAPEVEVIAHLVAQIRSLRPGAVVTFGPDGIYGHPDHLAIYRAATAAVQQAAQPVAPDLPVGLGEPWQTPALYYASLPRERIVAMSERRDGPFRSMPPEERAKLGTPIAEITAILRVDDLVAYKERAVGRHRTQVGLEGPFAGIPRDEVRQWMSWEFLRRVALPWDGSAPAASDPIADLAHERGADASRITFD